MHPETSAYRLELPRELGARVWRQLSVALVPTALSAVLVVLTALPTDPSWFSLLPVPVFAFTCLLIGLHNWQVSSLRIDVHGITGHRGELVPWDSIRFVHFQGPSLRVRLHRHDSVAMTVQIHSEGYGLSRGRHAERRRSIIAAVGLFAPGRYVDDPKEALRRAA
ncbi:hypothetical protein [Streptomyces sp. NPDC002187]|uniref:hypothetical protein n=1 Tax=Streptomyces sp. NPDC002187 TaxID=3364637 RepID=UPI003679D3C4